MPLSSRNILTDILRNNVLSAIWASSSPVKVTFKINDHEVFLSKFSKGCYEISNLNPLMIQIMSGNTKTPKAEEIMGSYSQVLSDDPWQRAAMPCTFVMQKAMPSRVSAGRWQ